MPLLLVGCWDERLYKNSAVVSMTGFEGEMGNITGYYAYPETTITEMKPIVITAEGVSPRDVRQNAELKTEQIMDLSELSTLLISEGTAKDDLYEYLDIYFRDAFSPITPRLSIIQGELKPFFELSEEFQTTAGEYYTRLITSLEKNSIVIPYTLQTAVSLFFEQAQDLTLPYLKIDEEDRPVAEGVALFSGRSYTGEILEPTQGVLLNVLNDSIGKSARITYIYKKSPLTVRISKVKKNIAVSENDIDISLKIDAILSEFPQEELRERKKRLEIEQFLTENLEKELKEVMEILQEAKCDAIGLGRTVRAYHPKLYKEEWSEHFSTLNIPIKVEVEIVKTGILY